MVDGRESYALAHERAKRWLQGCTALVIIAVTHEMLSRNIQGAGAKLSPSSTLARAHGQDRIYRLQHGQITELVVEA